MIPQGTSKLLSMSVSRRGFVGGAAGLTFAFSIGGIPGTRPFEADASENGNKLNAWITIGTDNTVTILSPAAEMGQGIITAS